MNADNDNLIRRTRLCGEVTEQDGADGLQLVLTGWVQRRRDLGQLIFIELRDASGLIQIVFDPSFSPEAHAGAEGLRQEYVVGVAGTVVPRESPNKNHPTGTIEVRAERLVLHNKAESVPFPVEDDIEVNEEVRLTHRYVDLRRPRMQKVLRTRHRLASAARAMLDEKGFVEIETPMLTRSTPEGARDYLVPSRIHEGSFYALPQSPQLFKQLLMVAGFDRYYQFARCFRDEDLRADRQPEFTQIDIEMSFVTPDDVFAAVEPMVVKMFSQIGVTPATPFPRISYAETMRRFGTDRPDTRFGLELSEVGDAARETGFKVFDGAIESGGSVRGIVLPGGAAATRKQIDQWTESVRKAGARGLVWIKIDAAGKIASSALKILGEERCRAVAGELGASPGDIALLVADSSAVSSRALGALRLRLADEWKLIPEGRWDLHWIEEFPLLDWAEDEKRYVAMHHPFTAPRWDEVDKLEQDPGTVVAQAYDLVLNGTEIAGGSIRIHRTDVQEQVFRALGIGAEEAQAKFGFLLRALQSGAPPHGGIAFGFDRVCAMLGGSESIRDVIAFPKTTRASCLMTDSPAPVDRDQLAQLHLRLAQDAES